jgi:ATP/maltotriose-dependent transcriptional regulator MalT
MREAAIANHALQRFVLLRDRGRLGELTVLVTNLANEYPGLPIWRCLRALLSVETTDALSARAEFESLAEHDFSDLPRDNFWLCCLAVLAKVGVALSDRQRSQQLAAMLRPFSDRHVSTNATYHGPVTLYLANLEALLGDGEAAERLFGAAAEQAERIGAQPFVLRARLDQAEFVAARGDAGDAERAATLAETIAAGARELGMDALVPRAMALASGDRATQV